ncbi:MAG: hypothetical protein QOG41_451 [Thermoleophilaceae bacterium]|nr:hypothetical protein [Thermoleophilaceae bacterium]
MPVRRERRDIRLKENAERGDDNCGNSERCVAHAARSPRCGKPAALRDLPTLTGPHARKQVRDGQFRVATGRTAAIVAPKPSATRATCDSLNPGKNGSASDRAATSSHTGNSPSRWPKRSR